MLKATRISSALDDPSRHAVLKNFPTESELLAVTQMMGAQVEYTVLEYYWVLRYTRLT